MAGETVSGPHTSNAAERRRDGDCSKTHRGWNRDLACSGCGDGLISTDGGLALFVVGTGQPICGGCAYACAPVLVGLLNLAVAVEDYHGEGAAQGLSPPIRAALENLCADMATQARAAEWQA